MTWFLTLLTVLLLSACSFKSSAPPPTIYTLPPVKNGSMPISKIVLSIPAPDVPAGFDTERIALYLNGGQRLDYYAGADWPDRLSDTLQKMLVQSAQQGHRFTASTSDFSSAYTLFVIVHDFEPIYASNPDRPPRLKASFTFRLVSADPQTTLMHDTINAERTAAANTQTAVMSGLKTLLQRIVAQAYERIDRLLEPVERQERMTKEIPPKTTDEGENR